MFSRWQSGADALVLADVGFCSHFWFFPCESPAPLLQAAPAARSSGLAVVAEGVTSQCP